MIGLLLKAVDRVIDLARIRDKKLRSRYEEIYKPSFLELQQVHTDYQILVSEVASRLLALKQEDFGNREHLMALHEHVRAEWLKLLPVRQKLKTLQDRLGDGKAELPALETEFLQSVARYFEVSGVIQRRNTSAATAILERLEQALAIRIAHPGPVDPTHRFVHAGPRAIDDLIQMCEGFNAHAEHEWALAASRFNDLRVTYAQSAS